MKYAKKLSAQTKQVWPSWLLCRTWMLLGPVLKQAFSYYSTLNLSSQICSSTEICMIVLLLFKWWGLYLCWADLRIKVRIGPGSQAGSHPWKRIGYEPLVISRLTRVLFTRGIQIENRPLKKHEKNSKSSHNNERYQGTILSYRGLGWWG
jgi:hypothetical protein